MWLQNWIFTWSFKNDSNMLVWFWRKICYGYQCWEELWCLIFLTSLTKLKSCFLFKMIFIRWYLLCRSRYSRERSLLVSYSASMEEWLFMLEREKRRKKMHKVIFFACFTTHCLFYIFLHLENHILNRLLLMDLTRFALFLQMTGAYTVWEERNP